jgi:prepilin-type N-terminal cleavage/methylation domain-containing protein
MKSRRAGFTMIELLIAITIILILAGIAASVLSGNRQTGKLRDAARIGQSAFLGAKDRALHAKDLRGVRLIRDTTDSTLITAFVYLSPLPLQTTGNLPGQPNQNDFALARPNYPPSLDATKVIISGTQATSWYTQDSNNIWQAPRIQIRIPAQTGQWYNLARQNNAAPYWWLIDANGNYYLTLQTPFAGGKPPVNNNLSNAIDPADANASCDIQLGNDLLPFHQPISLPSGVVIDLKFSSQNVQSLAGLNSGFIPYVDMMFSPRGMLTGYIAAHRRMLDADLRSDRDQIGSQA